MAMSDFMKVVKEILITQEKVDRSNTILERLDRQASEFKDRILRLEIKMEQMENNLRTQITADVKANLIGSLIELRNLREQILEDSAITERKDPSLALSSAKPLSPSED